MVGGIRISTSSPWRVSRASRNTRQYCDGVCRQRPGAAHVDIEAAIGGGDLDIKRLSDFDQRLGERPPRIERAVQAGIEDRAAIDGNDVMRICRGKTHLEHIVRADPGMQGNPAAARTMRVDQETDFAVKLRLRQRLDNDIALPGAVAFGFPVLDRAAPADCKMRAKRRDPLRACALDPEQAPAVGMARYGFNLDGLAAKRVRHIHALPVGNADAVAAMADVIDNETFNHGARRGRIRCCRRRP
jgi:hypothetical protein